MRWVLIPSLRITNPLTQRSLPPLLGYCSFFPFPPLEIIKSLVRTKEKSFFEHSSPKKASGVSSEKGTTIFPRDRVFYCFAYLPVCIAFYVRFYFSASYSGLSGFLSVGGCFKR